MEGAQTSLLTEARDAMAGAWRLLRGRADAIHNFDLSQRGLAGSFVPLVLASVGFVAFLGLGNRGAHYGVSGAAILFVIGGLMALRYGAMRLLLPHFDALHLFRPHMVVSNWIHAIALVVMLVGTISLAYLGALVLGPSSGETLVGMVLVLWGGITLAGLMMEVNTYRIVMSLAWSEVALVLGAQGVALALGLTIAGSLPIYG